MAVLGKVIQHSGHIVDKRFRIAMAAVAKLAEQMVSAERYHSSQWRGGCSSPRERVEQGLRVDESACVVSIQRFGCT